MLMANAPAGTVKDRQGAGRGNKARLEQDPQWNDNEPDNGFKLASLTRKPLLVQNCVHCHRVGGCRPGP